ncbi:TSUP family transporter [Limnobacter sp.]|uniref:TSUP family transporter n=1 Tax=Limnobacter sp. TaxID=2003368 RepID=UPI003510EDA8
MFENIEWWVLVTLCVAAFGAGLIDAMVGGGGLIQIPALFGLLPSHGHATLLGTNKISSVVGTSFAAYRYAKAIQVPWNAVLPATLMALLGAYLGAYIVTQVSTEVLRLLLPVLLLGVAIYTFVRKDLGSVHAPKLGRSRERVFGGLVGLAIGLYDGFFGPGTGSFLMVAFVVLFGFDFLAATAGAKVVNIACNLASLAWFAPAGHVIVALGLLMAAFNLAGAKVGSGLAIRKGAGFVRKVLLAVVGLLILRTGYDSYGPYLGAWFG